MSEAEPLKLPDMLGRLKQGAKVFVILHKDTLRERIDVRASEVLGLEDDVLFLAQTRQPVDRGQIGMSFEVAMLLDADRALRPVGYVARLLDIRADYPGPDHVQVSALAVSAPGAGDFFETSLRMHYRVAVDEDMGVLIRLEGPEAVAESAGLEALEGPEGLGQGPEETQRAAEAETAGTAEKSDTSEQPECPVNPAVPDVFDAAELLDFSAGGARVRLPGSAQAEVGQRLPFKLIFLGSGYADGIGVVRSAEREPDGSGLLLGLFFTNMDIRDIRYLERMVARIVSVSRQRERDAEYS